MTLRELNLKRSYSTSQADLLGAFYCPCLREANTYDRAAGFFSSSLIALAAVSFSEFVRNGGRMRLICSPYVTAQDAIRLDPEGAGKVPKEDVIAALRELAAASPEVHALTRVMSALVGSGILQVKFAVPVVGHGMFHDKVGIFVDSAGNRVTFVGSANETAAAWSGLGNHEQLEIFSSWQGPDDADRARRHAKDFEEMWLNIRPGLRVQPAGFSAAIINEVAPESDVESALRNARQVLESNELNRIGPAIQTPSSTVPPLREHQVAVVADWVKHGHRGLVRFATGGGKTLVGLEATRIWVESGRPALILVPSEILHEQWLQQIRERIPEASVVVAGAGASKERWMRLLRSATKNAADLGPRIVLATYQTANTPDFLARLESGDHLLVVADEVHRMGAADTRSLFNLAAGGRLGLSATPERYNDPEGTQAIWRFFENELTPAFSIADAIASNVLVPYDYYLSAIRLTEDESQRWADLTSQMARLLAINDGATSDRFEYLARERSRILKRAEEKTGLARRLLDENYSRGSHWLIYCESRDHLDEVRREIEGGAWPVYEYHSGNTALRSEIFDHFEKGGVLLAIKCLDEGVDIPAIDNALILASTTNPREYVQRRGRILRRSPNKYSARLFDVLVLTSEGTLISPNEASRAREFASHARNSSGRIDLEILLAASASSDYTSDIATEAQDGG